jgi:hypothetical protein
MKNEWQKLAEKLLFDFGKAVLGKNSGGMISMLLRERGIDGARNAILAASDKQNPREYAGAIMRDKPAESNVQIGEEVGGYRWTGSQWMSRNIHER